MPAIDARNVGTPPASVGAARRAYRMRPGELALLGAFCALCASLFDVGVVLVTRHLLGSFTYVGRDHLWMAPLAYLAFFGIVVVAMAPLVLLAPRVARSRAPALVLFTLAAFGMLVLLPGIHLWAERLLALGIGIRVTQLWRQSPERWGRGMRRASVAMAAVLAGAGIGTRAWRSTAELRWRAGTTSAPSDAPNVLILLLDTVRASSLSLYGYARPTTPMLERRAREATVFDRAISTAPWTLPSHCSLFTGRYAGELSCGWGNRMDGAAPTIAELLRDRGWRTAGFTANYSYATHETGLARGFTRWDDFKVSATQILASSSFARLILVRRLVMASSARARRTALRDFQVELDRRPLNDRKTVADVNREYLAWLDADRGNPSFAFLNYFDAHAPIVSRPALGDTTTLPEEQDAYDRAIAHMDREIDRLLRELERRGVLDRTIVIVTADHGEHWGEHGLTSHGGSLYLPLVHVPLAIRYPPRVPAGLRVSRSVSLRDLAATILELAGVRDARIPGTALSATWSDGGRASMVLAEVERSPNWWGTAPSRSGALQSIVDGARHYIRSVSGKEELYDLDTDPHERRNLALAADSARVLPPYRTMIPTDTSDLPPGASRRRFR